MQVLRLQLVPAYSLVKSVLRDLTQHDDNDEKYKVNNAFGRMNYDISSFFF